MPQTTLSKKQQEILFLLSRFRFLDRTHLQSLLHHKQKQRINKWLKDLTTKEYVTRKYNQSIIGPNKQPAVFSLATNGIRFLKTLEIYPQSFLRQLYKEKHRSDTFIAHSLLIATICLELEKKTTKKCQYSYATTSDRLNPQNPYHKLKNEQRTIDLAFHKKEKGRKKEHFLLTILDANLPRYRIRKKIREIIDEDRNNSWESECKIEKPARYFICETKELLIYTKRFTKSVLPDELCLNFATKKDAQELGITEEIWEEVYQNTNK